MDMVLQLIKWEFLKIIRSTSFGRSLLAGILLVGLGIILLSSVLLIGLVLKPIIVEGLGEADAILFLNSILIYFFLFEIIYRYFIQRLPVLEMESLLHLPIAKSWIVRFLLARSFVSPLTLISLLLFGPFALTGIAEVHGNQAAFLWLTLICFASWSIHWWMLWFKQRFEDSLIGVFVIFVFLLLGSGSAYYGLYNIGTLAAPLFSYAIVSVLPAVLMLIMFLVSYFLCYSYYRRHTYLEDLGENEEVRSGIPSWGFFSKFGSAGEMAELEWRLIVRHKKSRTYLMLCGFFLLYGLVFYTNAAFQSEEGFSYLFIFVGSFITGIFILQYGQLFLSWNSANFDFFLLQEDGIASLVKGKYILFITISCICFMLSVPYVYFGLDYLLIHLATLIFNIGVTIHLVIFMSLWKPKPMDLNKGSMFNYEGVGLTQFIMVIPLMLAPYAVFLPFAHLINDYAGLAALAIIGALGIFGYKPLVQLSVRQVTDNRYEISSSFRQEV